MFDLEETRELFSDFTFADALDVAIISGVVYGLLRVMRGTRAMTQLRGAALVVVAALALGQIFDLVVVNYLLDEAAGLAVIAAVVIFQPELRRALDRMGRTAFAPRLLESRRKAAIHAISEAAGTLSSRRHGALMVIERDTGLQDITEGGVPVDGRVSAELLENIFFPNSPLHDMAAVIREDRVLAAGCVLPLSELTSDNGRTLGTRHRAAVGITEVTDAVSVIVSEETGDISIALGGRLTAVADADRLETVLQWLLQPQGAPAEAVPSGGAA